MQVFVYRPGRPLLRLPDCIKGGSLTGGHLAMTPSLEHVITGWVGLGPRDMGDWRVELYRIELRTGKASPWVKGCFSPALSPRLQVTTIVLGGPEGEERRTQELAWKE